MKIVILTGGEFRHKYFANRICDEFDVPAVFTEEKALRTRKSDTDALTGEEKELWDWHFGLAKKEEERFFGRETAFAATEVIAVPHGMINDSAIVAKIKSYTPDAIAVFGTSILKDEIIGLCPGKIINMHLGLSPYYRGSATNFWPLHNGEPQYVGVTIHRIDRGIDTGAIIHQGRPEIERGDNQHSIGNKTIIVGTLLMMKALQELSAGALRAFPQEEKGRLYQRKDFSVGNLRTLKRLMDEGLIDQYLETKDSLATIKLIP